MDSARKLIQKYKKSSTSFWNYDEEIDEVHVYFIDVPTSNGKNSRVIIELHVYHGFAMVKFYPKYLKNSKLKYQLRGNELTISFGIGSIRKIFFECALLMRDYLSDNPDCFVGYVGQTDDKDNDPKKRRKTSQRADIYNLLTNSIFLHPKYKLSSSKIFAEVNLRLIRTVRSQQIGRITKIQKSNYDSFLSYFNQNNDNLFELMTEETRNQYLE